MLNPQRTTVDEEFVRNYYHITGLSSNPKNFRVKIVLTTNNVLFRPRAKRMMAILKTI